MINLLRRAWDTLDTFKQAYPENWHDEDEQVLKDLMRADLKLSGVKLKWVGLTEKDFSAINQSCLTKLQAAISAESILKEKNNGT